MHWHGFLEGRYDRAELSRRMARVREELYRLLQKGEASNEPELAGSCTNLLAHFDALWTFVSVPGVEPTNNHAERELLGFVIWRKLSFGTKSERGNVFAEHIMTVAYTLKKQGGALLDFLKTSTRLTCLKTKPLL